MLLKDKVQYALDETRMLILGVQVLLGFTYQAFLQHAFDALPPACRWFALVSLALLLVATTLLLAPVARHRIVDEGKDTVRLHRFTTRVSELALLPFALALAADFYIVGARVQDATGGLGCAVAAALVAVVAWYAAPFAARKPAVGAPAEEGEMLIDDKIRHVLAEARVVLPGTQALLGFQCAAVLQDGFDKLPPVSKNIHLAGFGLFSLSVVLLMFPAAFHRIAERGEISERLHRVASACILGAMATLSAGLACATFVVVLKGAGSMTAAVLSALGWLAVSFATWFGLTLVVRAKERA